MKRERVTVEAECDGCGAEASGVALDRWRRVSVGSAPLVESFTVPAESVELDLCEACLAAVAVPGLAAKVAAA